MSLDLNRLCDDLGMSRRHVAIWMLSSGASQPTEQRRKGVSRQQIDTLDRSVNARRLADAMKQLGNEWVTAAELEAITDVARGSCGSVLSKMRNGGLVESKNGEHPMRHRLTIRGLQEQAR